MLINSSVLIKTMSDSWGNEYFIIKVFETLNDFKYAYVEKYDAQTGELNIKLSKEKWEKSVTILLSSKTFTIRFGLRKSVMKSKVIRHTSDNITNTNLIANGDTATLTLTLSDNVRNSIINIRDVD